jgi:hypothetical protein
LKQNPPQLTPSNCFLCVACVFVGKIEIHEKFWLILVTLMNQMGSETLRILVLKTIEVYNRYRCPEVKAKLVEMKNNGFVIDFEGTFCQSCGVKDYFDDFSAELEDISKTECFHVVESDPTGPQSFRVTYQLKDKQSSEADEEALFKDFLMERGITFNEYLEYNACTKDVILFQFRTWLYEKKQIPET